MLRFVAKSLQKLRKVQQPLEIYSRGPRKPQQNRKNDENNKIYDFVNLVNIAVSSVLSLNHIYITSPIFDEISRILKFSQFSQTPLLKLVKFLPFVDAFNPGHYNIVSFFRAYVFTRKLREVQ